MYEIIKHTKKQTTTLFTTPCEAIAKTRFAKSAGLLKLNESLELLHQGQVIDSAKKELAKAEDEDEDIIFPEAPSTWGRVGAVESLMKSLYCIAGSLPAQFRSSSVDCGIGWKEHAKQEPRKAAPNSDKAKVSLGDVAVLAKTGSSSVRLNGPSY